MEWYVVQVYGNELLVWCPYSTGVWEWIAGVVSVQYRCMGMNCWCGVSTVQVYGNELLVWCQYSTGVWE